MKIAQIISDYVKGSRTAPIMDNMFGWNECYLCGLFVPSYYPDGRYVFHGNLEELEGIAESLRARVLSGEIGAFKYRNRGNQGTPFEGEEPAMVVYAKKADSAKVWSILAEAGVTDALWKDGNPLFEAACGCWP